MHTTSINTIYHTKTDDGALARVSGYRAHCGCGWKSSFSVNRGIVEGSAKAHRELASRRLASR